MGRDRFLFYGILILGITFLPTLALPLPAWAGGPDSPYKDILRLTEKGKKRKQQEFTTTRKSGWLEPDTDRPGSDYKSFWLTGGCEQCQKACFQDPRCKAYTYVRPKKKGAKARCWLKSSVPAPVPNKNCISGVKPQLQASKTPYAGTLKRSDAVKFEPKQQPDLESSPPQNETEEPQGYQEEEGGDYGYTYDDTSSGHDEDYYVYTDEEPYEDTESDYAYPEEKRDILEELGVKVWADSQEESMPSEVIPEEQPAEGKPYAGGALEAVVGERPELLITNIDMRNPNKRELMLNRELKPHDLVFEVKVVNIGKTPVSNVGVLVAVRDERLEATIERTMERNEASRVLIYMRPSREIRSAKSLEVSAIVDPYEEYSENNEENNLFTKTFKLVDH